MTAPITDKRKKSHKPARRHVLRNTMIGLAIVSAGVLTFGAYLLHKADTALTQMSVTGSTAETAAAAQAPNAAIQKPMSFMLTGVDSREGSGGTLNTDVMMLVSLNPETRSATVVSIPRDMEFKPKEFGLSSQKANYYYAYYYNQDRTTSLTKTKKLFSDMFDLPLDYMATIDFDGFRQVVDELNGLELDVDMDMRYVDTEDGTDINLKKGVQTLDGKKTLDFLRYRKSNRGTDESSDTARNERQQQVLDKLLGKLTSFDGISQWGGILGIAGKTVQTDIPPDTLRQFILSMRQLKPDHIEFIHLDGRWDSPYIVPKEEDLTAAVASLRTQLGLPADSRMSSSTAYSVFAKRFGIDPTPGRRSLAESTGQSGTSSKAALSAKPSGSETKSTAPAKTTDTKAKNSVSKTDDDKKSMSSAGKTGNATGSNRADTDAGDDAPSSSATSPAGAADRPAKNGTAGGASAGSTKSGADTAAPDNKTGTSAPSGTGRSAQNGTAADTVTPTAPKAPAAPTVPGASKPNDATSAVQSAPASTVKTETAAAAKR